jgi:molybdopterin molybdotransferase
MRIAADMEPAPPIRVGLHSAIASLLAQPVAALADLPPVASVTATGYAVRGIGPWTVMPGLDSDEELPDGVAVVVREGDPLPLGAGAALSLEHAVVEHTAGADVVLVGNAATGMPDRRPGMLAPGSGILAPGAEARAGDLLIKAGTVVTAGTVALAAAAGVDELVIIPPATVAPVMMGSDLLHSGPPRRGRNRDIVAPLLPSWIMGAGARCLPEIVGVSHNGSALADQIDSVGADLTVLTATSEPGVGHSVGEALRHLRAEILIDRLAADPARDVLLAELRDGRRLLALPREPAGAIVTLALLLTPMMAALSGRSAARVDTVMLRENLPLVRYERAVAVQIENGELADLGTVQPWSGPHGLAAVGTADAIAFIDPGRGNRGDSVPVVALPGRI